MNEEDVVMPIYEYACKACGYRHEALQKMSDDALTDCPECGKPALKKLVSAAGFRLKGSGWYETDFKGGKKNADKGDTDSGAGSSDSAPKKAAVGGCGSGG